MSLTLNQLNNLELYYPNKIFKVFSFDINTIKDGTEFTNKINENTVGFIRTSLKTNVKIAILIFKDETSLNALLKYLSSNMIDYHMDRYTYRSKTYLNNLFNEHNYYTNIEI